MHCKSFTCCSGIFFIEKDWSYNSHFQRLTIAAPIEYSHDQKLFQNCIQEFGRNKIFTFINISGFAVGIAVCLAIFLIIQFELSFDDFHKNKNRIYRILTEMHNADGIRHSRGVPYPLPTAMHNDFPSLKSSAVYSSGDDQIVIPNETSGATLKKFKEEDGVLYVEPTFFAIFDFPLLAGDYRSLKDPNTVIITNETAERYFGDWQQAINRPIRINGNNFFGETR